MRTTIEIRGARENNLKNVDVEIPRDKLVVVTGVSGSGKSSLAFDTLYAEGQRRLLASMSTFAKRFIGQLKKPDVDFVNGLSPVVSIDQKTVGSNPRSTVGTMTDVSDYLRMLFATMGTPHCPMCGEALVVRTPHQMMEHMLALPKGTEVEVRAPVYKIHGEDYEFLFEQIRVTVGSPEGPRLVHTEEVPSGVRTHHWAGWVDVGDADTWLAVTADGDTPMPLEQTGSYQKDKWKRPGVTPFALASPILIDADQDGTWTRGK